MSETMVERVARALFERSIYHGYNDETKRSEWLRNRSILMASARAAIEAMRTPNLAMRKACSFRAAEEDWPRMIDAALTEEPSE